MAGRLRSVLASREWGATIGIGLTLIGLAVAASASARSLVAGIHSGDLASAAARDGSCSRDAGAVGSFGKALARRYGGGFSDPQQPGAALSRVRYYQAWNEPNLNTYLSPQWSNGHAESPDDYRALLNAFYGAV